MLQCIDQLLSICLFSMKSWRAKLKFMHDCVIITIEHWHFHDQYTVHCTPSFAFEFMISTIIFPGTISFSSISSRQLVCKLFNFLSNDNNNNNLLKIILDFGSHNKTLNSNTDDDDDEKTTLTLFHFFFYLKMVTHIVKKV